MSRAPNASYSCGGVMDFSFEKQPVRSNGYFAITGPARRRGERFVLLALRASAVSVDRVSEERTL